MWLNNTEINFSLTSVELFMQVTAQKIRPKHRGEEDKQFFKELLIRDMNKKGIVKSKLSWIKYEQK